MVARAMDGSIRRRKEVTPCSVAQSWFKRHSKTRVVAHWRWDELSQATRENMEAVRDTRLSGRVVIFGPHRSELSLANLQAAEIKDSGNLVIAFAPGREMEYAGVEA